MFALFAPAPLSLGLRAARAESATSISSGAGKNAANVGLPIAPAALSNAETFSLGSKIADFSSRAVADVAHTAAWMSELTAAPSAPAGLGAARVPTRAEHLLTQLSATSAGSALLSFFGFAAETGVSPAADSAAEAVEPVAAAMMGQPAGTVAFDYDGDRRADVSCFKRSSSAWSVRNSGAAISLATGTVFGTPGGVMVPADYDGDGKTDFATFKADTHEWKIRDSSTGGTRTALFGDGGDRPVPADYDGDGRADTAVWRPANGTWYVWRSSDNQSIAQQFGLPGDVPVPGNYDGDGRADYVVWRPAEGNWYKLASSGGFSVTQWGLNNDIPVAADYDGDGKTDLAVFRRETGTWYVYQSRFNDGRYESRIWGNYGDQPVAADFDGDSRADYAVWRPSTGVWYIIESSTGNTTYRTAQLGATGDAPTEAAYLKQAGFEVAPNALAAARLSLKNATGGTNLYSRNWGWGTDLVNLPGRAGLDLSIGLSYNSLVWTKTAAQSQTPQAVMTWDADMSNLTAGFRFGFPTIEQSYLDAQTGQYNYLLVSPSGARTVLRQTAATGVYEAADSSCLQLKLVVKNGAPVTPDRQTLTLRSTDGTQLTFTLIAGLYRCVEIKDANGNFITINHDGYGVLRSAIDTLGRTVNFNYYAPNTADAYLLESITQQWQNGVHTWAQFSYASVQLNPNFGAAAINGPANNATLRLLSRVSFADNSSTRFEYNPYGQIWKISRYAADNTTLLNYTQSNLSDANPAAAADDCPRFSNTQLWAKDFNLDQNNVAQEVVTGNDYIENFGYQLADGTQKTGTLVRLITPDGTHHNSYVAASGWAESLVQKTETWEHIGGNDYTARRWTYSVWTQDDTNLPYQMNPRQTAQSVNDGGSSRRTEIEYYEQFGLVKGAKEFDERNGNKVLLRSNRIDYNLGAAYTSRRIIGLSTLR